MEALLFFRFKQSVEIISFYFHNCSNQTSSFPSRVTNFESYVYSGAIPRMTVKLQPFELSKILKALQGGGYVGRQLTALQLIFDIIQFNEMFKLIWLRIRRPLIQMT